MYLVGLLLGEGCSNVLGLSDYAAESQVTSAATENVECTSHTDCAGELDSPTVCVQNTHKCVPLKSPDCTTVTGDYTDDAAVVIGSLFSFAGAQVATSTARQNSALLAVQEINQVGGIPQREGAAGARPLVMVSCDASADLLRVGKHLVDELQVPAIIGPNSSQDTIDLSRQVSVPGGTVVITPTALASNIADLADNGLTWQMVPTDIQRGDFMTMQIMALAEELRAARLTDAVKFAAVFRDDALGIGTRTSLNALRLNGEPLATLINLGQATVDAYDLGTDDQQPIVRKYVDFQPDIIVLAGTSELVVNVLVPLERAWQPDKPRPHYMLIDSVKNKELLDAAGMSHELRRRIRGTGITPSPKSVPVYEAFRVSYDLAYPGSPTDVSGLGPTYDATYAVAFALAATHDQPPSGRAVAEGLRMLSDGPVEIRIQAVSAIAAFSRLAMKQPISAIGTFGPLAWGSNGAVLGGTLELWCIANQAGRLSYQSSGLTLDLATGTEMGKFEQCE